MSSMVSNDFPFPHSPVCYMHKDMATFGGYSPLPPYCAPSPRAHYRLKSGTSVFQWEFVVLCESASLDNSL